MESIGNPHPSQLPPSLGAQLEATERGAEADAASLKSGLNESARSSRARRGATVPRRGRRDRRRGTRGWARDREPRKASPRPGVGRAARTGGSYPVGRRRERGGRPARGARCSRPSALRLPVGGRGGPGGGPGRKEGRGKSGRRERRDAVREETAFLGLCSGHWLSRLLTCSLLSCAAALGEPHNLIFPVRKPRTRRKEEKPSSSLGLTPLRGQNQTAGQTPRFSKWVSESSGIPDIVLAPEFFVGKHFLANIDLF